MSPQPDPTNVSRALRALRRALRAATVPVDRHGKFFAMPLLYVFLASLFFSFMFVDILGDPERDYISGEEVVAMTEDGDFVEGTYYPENERLALETSDGRTYLSKVEEKNYPALAEQLHDGDVSMRVTMGYFTGSAVGDTAGTSPWAIVPVAVAGSWLFVVTLTNLFTRAIGNQRPVSPAAVSNIPTDRFSDVAGADEAIADLREMVAFLAHPAAYAQVGAKAPRGALLVGTPGTGKTLLARAVAGEAGVEFFSASGSDFVQKYMGEGARKVRELFDAARAAEKAIVFIDEIDAIGGSRGASDGSSASHNSSATLIALLNELDGFKTRGNVLVLAATNRSDMLDSALTRPGRLDRRIEVPNPDRRGREQILAVHAKSRPLADDVDLNLIARRTPGFSGAQLAALVNEAAMTAARSKDTVVRAEHFSAAVATVAMGRARTSAVVTAHDSEVTAWHEAGHTAAAWLLPEADKPVAVSIVPRGPAGGVTWMAGGDDIFLSRRKAHSQLVVALSGRAGEQLVMDGEYTSGCSGDLSAATNTATAMVTQYGMSKLGLSVRKPDSTGVTAEVDRLLADAYSSAQRLLAANRDFVAALAFALLEEEDLDAARIAEIAAEHTAVVDDYVLDPIPAPAVAEEQVVTGQVVSSHPTTPAAAGPVTVAAAFRALAVSLAGSRKRRTPEPTTGT